MLKINRIISLFGAVLLFSNYASATVHTIVKANNISAKNAPMIKMQQPTSINVSRDIVSLGIGQQNLTPNNPNIDAGPLIAACAKYATAHGIHSVLIPGGNYYFNSVTNRVYLYLQDIKNVNIQGSIDGITTNFIFKTRKAGGIIIRDCYNTGIQNLTMDYTPDLPFTVATVSEVDYNNMVIHIASVNGRSISDFRNAPDNSGNTENPNRAPSGPMVDKTSLRAFVLRKSQSGEMEGLPINRFFISQDDPTDKQIKIMNVPDAKTAAHDLGMVRPGDVLMITERDYSSISAMLFLSYPPKISYGNYAKGITVYSSPAMGVISNWQNNLTFSDIKVIPKPGREQYISSNADGISMSNSGSGNSITNSTVRYSGDDCISFANSLYATVVSVTSPNTLVVANKFLFSVGQKLSFIDAVDMHELGTPKVLSSQALTTRTNGLKNTILQLDQPVPNVTPGAQIFVPVEERSNGIMIANNTLERGYARGIYFSGVAKAKIFNNTTAFTSSCGILGQSNTNIPGNNNVEIQGNIVKQAFGQGLANEHGGIDISVSGNNNASMVNNNINIHDNIIIISGNSDIQHVGVYVTHVQGVTLMNNSVQEQSVDGRNLNLSADRFLKIGGAVQNIIKK